MDKHFVVDTNILLKDMEVIQKYNIVLLSHTLRELDKHKSSHRGELAYRARCATRYIKNNRDEFLFDMKDYDGSDIGDKSYEDNNIIKACLENNYGLLTNDVLMGFKAEGLNIEVIEVDDAINDDLDYKGYKFVDLNETDLANFYENIHHNKFDLRTNQYLVVRDIEGNTVDKYRWNGEKHVSLNLPPKKTLNPKNDLQACAIDLLNNKDIPIKIIAGTYGSGKSYINTKMALYHVKDKGDYSKIMVVRNPVGSGEAIGWLKGSKEDKTDDFFKPIIQHLEGGEQEATYMEQRGQLIKDIPFYMKGLSIEDTFMIVDEAEDLDVKTFKMIGTRIADKAAITFSGDYQQSEDKFTGDNGLLNAINTLKGNPLVGIIVLDKDVRSEASKVFAEM